MRKHSARTDNISPSGCSESPFHFGCHDKISIFSFQLLTDVEQDERGGCRETFCGMHQVLMCLSNPESFRRPQLALRTKLPHDDHGCNPSSAAPWQCCSQETGSSCPSQPVMPNTGISTVSISAISPLAVRSLLCAD